MLFYRLKIGLIILSVLCTGSAQAAYVWVDKTMANHTLAKALSLDGYFDSSGNQDATNPWDYEGTRYALASAIKNTVVSAKDWYSFKVDNSDTKVFLDIDGTDGTWRSWLGLYDGKGARIDFNATGEIFDPGSSIPWDSFLFVTLQPGRYNVAVARDNNAPLRRGQNYILNVGLGQGGMLTQAAAVSQVPIPAGLWLFGSACASLLMRSRRHSASSLRRRGRLAGNVAEGYVPALLLAANTTNARNLLYCPSDGKTTSSTNSRSHRFASLCSG